MTGRRTLWSDLRWVTSLNDVLLAAAIFLALVFAAGGVLYYEHGRPASDHVGIVDGRVTALNAVPADSVIDVTTLDDAHRVATVHTTPDGRFHLQLPPGRYVITARPQTAGSPPGSQSVRLYGGEVLTTDVRLGSGSGLAGTQRPRRGARAGRGTRWAVRG